MGHHHEEVSLLQGQLLDLFFVGGGLALEDNLLGIDGVPLLVSDLFLEFSDLDE